MASKRKAKQTELVWTTREGIKIPIKKMTEAHLKNTIKYLEEKYLESLGDAYSFAGSCSGDMATYYAYGMADDVRPSPWLPVLQKELERRNYFEIAAKKKT